MNKEQYVTFEVAKLLKEKGFDWELRTYYNEEGYELRLHDEFSDISNDCSNPDYIEYLDFYCVRPTQQMAMRWLRTRGINIEPITCPECYTWRVVKRYKATNGLYGIRIVDTGLQGSFDEYEDAVEEALKYCLTKLI